MSKWETATEESRVPLRVRDRPSVSGVLLLEVYGQDEFSEPKRLVRRAASSVQPTLGVPYSEEEMVEIYELLKDRVLYDLMQGEKGIDHADDTYDLTLAVEALKDRLTETIDNIFSENMDLRDRWRKTLQYECWKVQRGIRTLHECVAKAQRDKEKILARAGSKNIEKGGGLNAQEGSSGRAD